LNTYRIYRSGDIDVFPLSIVREPTTDGYKPQGSKNTLDPDPRGNESKSMGRDLLEGGIKASPIIQHEEQQKAKYFEGLE
jgi:hypothetical protein